MDPALRMVSWAAKRPTYLAGYPIRQFLFPIVSGIGTVTSNFPACDSHAVLSCREKTILCSHSCCGNVPRTHDDHCTSLQQSRHHLSKGGVQSSVLTMWVHTLYLICESTAPFRDRIARSMPYTPLWEVAYDVGDLMEKRDSGFMRPETPMRECSCSTMPFAVTTENPYRYRSNPIITDLSIVTII
jgi:hypothetical protein